ncbi:MAG: phosphatase PAP2 family protein [Jatrophihabitantaceae bacterium]
MTAVAGRIALAWLPFTATLASARSRRVGNWEHVTTRRLNRLPEVLHRPLWLVMQSGTAGAPVVAGGVALALGRPALAVRLAGSGITAYVLAKGVKRAVRRGRPGELVVGIRIRGRPATGSGYVSGHAAVSMALAAEMLPACTSPARALPLATASVVAVARVYVGAHLPLDAVGGAALGWAISRTVAEVRGRAGTGSSE